MSQHVTHTERPKDAKLTYTGVAQETNEGRMFCVFLQDSDEAVFNQRKKVLHLFSPHHFTHTL